MKEDIYARITPEVLAAADFRRSPDSDDSGSCIEVAVNLLDEHGFVLMRDSKSPDGPFLAYTRAEWEAFVGGVMDGEFDL